MRIFTIFFFLFFSCYFNGNSAKFSKSRNSEYDSLFVARCEAKCFANPKSECVKTCLVKGLTKPGECSRNLHKFESPFETACIKACKMDSHCPGLGKCCKHQCGITCQMPKNLENATGVPEIPTDLIVREGKRKKTVYIEWKSEPEEGKSQIIYVLEERHHIGPKFNKEKLSEWSFCGRTTKDKTILKNFVKPGTWYQFRVAAVNENGTKGYSQNFFTFTTSNNPKPPKAPTNMRITPVKNDSFSVELSWTEPQSDLPIHKYKVFWSRRLHGVRALDSVLVHQQTVPKDQNKFLLHNLKPNSLYFLQVQAIVQFGGEKLKGEKSGHILNTTSISNITTNEIVPLNSGDKKIKGVRFERLFWSQGELRARIVWKPKKTNQKFAVSWWTVACNGKNKGFNHFKAAATTKGYRFDLYDLHFNCRYKVNVREIHSTSFRMDSTITFSTPACSSFKNTYKKANCIINH